MLWLTTLQIRLAFSLPMSIAWLGMENCVGTNLWKMNNIQRYEILEYHWYCRLVVTTIPQDTLKLLLWFYSHLASHHSNAACIQGGEVPTQWHHSLSLATASYIFLKRSCLFHNWTLHLLIICFGGGVKRKKPASKFTWTWHSQSQTWVGCILSSGYTLPEILVC